MIDLGYVLEQKIREIIDSNITEIPWQGQEVDKESLFHEFCELLKEELNKQ